MIFWIKKCMEYYLIHHCTSLKKRAIKQFSVPPDPLHLNELNEPEAHFCFVKGGFDKIVEKLEKEVRSLGVKILTDVSVTHILDQDTHVQLKTSHETYEAQTVISTIPIGVLKAKATHLFSKPLSPEKIKSLETVGIHDATRIVLEFENPFWSHLEGPFLLIASPRRKGFIEFRNGSALHGKAILTTESYADIATAVWEKKSKQSHELELINRVMFDLRSIFPNAPAPIYTHIYRWTSDAFAMGSYPYRTVDSTESAQLDLEKNEGNIYFAGADFSRHGFSVHHAFAHGQAVAELILDRSK